MIKKFEDFVNENYNINGDIIEEGLFGNAKVDDICEATYNHFNNLNKFLKLFKNEDGETQSVGFMLWDGGTWYDAGKRTSSRRLAFENNDVQKLLPYGLDVRDFDEKEIDNVRLYFGNTNDREYEYKSFIKNNHIKKRKCDKSGVEFYNVMLVKNSVTCISKIIESFKEKRKKMENMKMQSIKF